MFYPDHMTADDIIEFEYEYNRLRDIQEGVGFWEINAELQVVAKEQQELLVD
jgi:hypothetical protein